MQKLVSVITPAYNAERFIQETIDSVRRQTYQNWEHLVVIDCNSKDATEKMVREISAQDPRVKCITSSKAYGAAENRNIGLEQAQGEYLAFLDADDLWASNKLENQVQFMEKHDYAFTYTAYTRISEDSKTLGDFIPAPERVTYLDLLKNNRVGCLTALVKKSEYKNITFIEEGWEDLNLWLHLLKQKPYGYGLNENLAFYRIVHGSRSNNKFYSARRRWNSFRKVEKMNWLTSLYYFFHYTVTGFRKHFLIKICKIQD